MVGQRLIGATVLASGLVLALIAVQLHYSEVEQQSVLITSESSHLLHSYAKESDMIDGPTDAEDGSLYNAPFREAKLGTIHSKDIFQQGMKIAKLQESNFEAKVEEEKEKDLSSQLAKLRANIHKHHKMTASSAWKHVEATADSLFSGLSHIRKRDGSTRIEIHIDAKDSAHRPEEPRDRTSSADSERKRHHSRHAARQQAHFMHYQSAGSASRRRRAERAHADRKAHTQGLEEITTALSHRIHRTRPGETGGVVCAPPFCDGDDLPAVLPGESAAVSARQMWRHVAAR